MTTDWKPCSIFSAPRLGPTVRSSIIRIGAASAPERSSSQQYLSRFEHIWELQSYLLSEADNSAMNIINNDDMDHTTERVMRSINGVLARGFSAKVEDIFSNR